MADIFRIFVGVLFVGAGISKARDICAFEAAVAAYRVVTRQRAKAVALLVLIAEFTVGAGLVTGLMRAASVTAAFVLLGVLSGAVVLAMLRSKQPTRCGCKILGIEAMIGWHICVRNLALALLLAPSLRPFGFQSAVVLFIIAAALILGSALRSDPALFQIRVAHFSNRIESTNS